MVNTARLSQPEALAIGDVIVRTIASLTLHYYLIMSSSATWCSGGLGYRLPYGTATHLRQSSGNNSPLIIIATILYTAMISRSILFTYLPVEKTITQYSKENVNIIHGNLPRWFLRYVIFGRDIWGIGNLEGGLIQAGGSEHYIVYVC
jgi:hypothetical protein